jgi:hypothetical protein
MVVGKNANGDGVPAVFTIVIIVLSLLDTLVEGV